jgi:transcriptional regulator with XRE-family HTH domain
MDAAPSSAADDSTATRQFRRELRRWRTRNGLTQRALADRVRFSRETVAAVESGRRYGSHELAVRCDEVLGTGGRLAALWPRVAAEQLAADGRRGPRLADPGRPDRSRHGPGSTLDLLAADQRAVVDTIDELRDLIDRMLRAQPPAGAADQRHATTPRRPVTESRRGFPDVRRRGRPGAVGRPR